ncbi:L-histidine N(alpha)-methyltransferase [Hydrogenophaga sp. A37]|uniref:L-histidine N(alpha)-methyltransferase n=1 Tax=Hydrogenophaga sp. A37 TaxID=1945864 RepID=UPI000985CEA1|nr:L-histidine N(alpha)-methyltransferase [Hydrogenophaga sp. A37]OOG87835.1 L-histidine N(alpha)-methyltransferase [Hydrogenophaga sp. A37]
MHKPPPAPHFVQLHQTDHAAVRAELAAGLLAHPPHASPKFFYDALGSRLFDAITELAEYYPTRTEAALFAQHGADMAQRVPAGVVLIDLGAGNCAKAASLFAVLRPTAYVAVDISVDYLRGAMGQLQQRHPERPMLGLGMDFSSELALPPAATEWLARHELGGAPRCVFYPGSSIGNFNPIDALALLRQARAVCAEGGPGGGLLIGVDRVKDKAVLEPAYDDPLGVTAAFNRNLLLHTNALLGADFAPARWQHVAFFNETESRIEMHLQANGAQTVRWPGGERAFVDGERLHTENSYKWAPADFDGLLREAGFGPAQHWTDPQGWFSVFWAPV